MSQFDAILPSDDVPVRHHTFYFDDGNVILNVLKPIPTGNNTYYSA